jgi:ATP diphosphatase
VGFADQAAATALARLEREVAELVVEPSEHELGDVLFAAVAVARSLRVDAEIALRSAAARFRARVERAATLAWESEVDFADAALDEQVRWYRLAHAELSGRGGEGG